MTKGSNPYLKEIGWPVVLLVCAKLALHLTTNALGGYGYFRDELYYIACSEHPAFGYVDHPPFSIFLLIISRNIFGDSLFGLRLLPALAGGATVLLAALTAKEMGGGVFARSVAALSALISPVFLGMQTFYSMNAFDLLFWAAAGYVMTRMINEESRTLWIVLGVVLGFGLLNKVGVLFLGFGIAAGLLLTPRRSALRTAGPWVCALISIPLFLPYILWNTANDYAHLEFIRNASSGKYSGLTPLRFLTDQFLINNPLTIPVWCGGLLFYFRTEKGKKYRWLGYAFAGAAIVLLLNQTSKAEYLAAGYTMLFAGGGVFWEDLLSEGRRPRVRWILAALLSSGLLLAPFGLPILPVEAYRSYASTLGISPSTSENRELAGLPQFYADMFGWEEQVDALATVYHSLPPEEQKRCVIYCDNYGRAGAVDFFGRKQGLPNAVSGHNTYWLWGTRGKEIATVIMFDNEMGEKEKIFDSVTVAGTYRTPYALPSENNLTIYVCRKPLVPFDSLWKMVRSYE